MMDSFWLWFSLEASLDEEELLSNLAKLRLVQIWLFFKRKEEWTPFGKQFLFSETISAEKPKVFSYGFWST